MSVVDLRPFVPNDESVTTAKIADNAVTTAKVNDAAITTAKINDVAVTAAKLASDAVTTVKILDANVTTAKIADANITADKIAADAVVTAKILDANVTTAKIADANVTAGKLASDAVTTAKILDANVTTAKIADNAITTEKILDANVTTAKILDANVTAGKLASDAVTTAKILDANVTTAKINDAAITTAKINDTAVTTAKITDANITTAKIADSNITTAKIADSAITNAKLANVNAGTVKGNVGGGPAAPSDLTATQLTTLVNAATSSLSGAMTAAQYTQLSHLPATVALDATGAVNNATAFSNLLSGAFASGGTMHLPAGTILLEAASGSGWTLPANLKMIGHPSGTTIKFKNPAAVSTQKWFTLSDNVELQDLTLQWDKTTPPAAGNSGIMIWAYSASGDTATTGVTGIKMRRVIVSGAGEDQDYILSNHFVMQLIGVSNSYFEDCDFRWSLGSCWGVEIIGGENLLFHGCRFYENSADGLKIQGSDYWANGNTLFTKAKNHRFLGCLFYRNGWQVRKGDTTATATYTQADTSIPSVVNGGRYLLNGSGDWSISLPTASPGDIITIQRKVGSDGTPTLTTSGGLEFINGDSFGNMSAPPITSFPITEYHTTDSRDLSRTGLRFTYSASPNRWTATTGYNGEGADVAGENIVFESCCAHENQGAGLQVKPSETTATAIRLTNCTSVDNWGSGFLVHNANAGSTTAGPTNIMLDNCVAVGNFEAGFSFIQLVHVGLKLTCCLARSNRGYGYSFQRTLRETLMMGCDARGNGKGYYTLTGGYAWNVAISQANKLKMIGCTLSGVDGVDQSLDIDNELDTGGNARCYGLYVLRESSAAEMNGVELIGTTFHNHQSSVNVSYAYQGANSGTLNNWGEYQLWYPQTPVSGESFLTVGTSSVSVPFTRPGYTAPIVGLATSGASTTITDTGAAFPTSPSLAGYVVRITGGTGAGQWRAITSNTPTALTISTGSTNWTTNPDNTSTYEVIGLQVTLPYTPLARDIVITPTSPLQTAAAWQIRNIATTGFDVVTYNSSGAKAAISAGVTGTATAQTTTSLTDTAKTWSDDEWNGFLIRITGGVTTPNGGGQYRTITDTVGGGTDRVDVATWINPSAGTSTYVIGDWAFGWKVQRG